jgi:hypothetical protein
LEFSFKGSGLTCQSEESGVLRLQCRGDAYESKINTKKMDE